VAPEAGQAAADGGKDTRGVVSKSVMHPTTSGDGGVCCLQTDLNLSNVEYELVRIDAAAGEGEAPAAGSAEQPPPS